MRVKCENSCYLPTKPSALSLGLNIFYRIRYTIKFITEANSLPCAYLIIISTLSLDVKNINKAV